MSGCVFVIKLGVLYIVWILTPYQIYDLQTSPPILWVACPSYLQYHFDSSYVPHLISPYIGTTHKTNLNC